jgi:hypothetical protein
MSGNLEYILLGVICVLATICAFVAKKKGYSFWHWFLLLYSHMNAFS